MVREPTDGHYETDGGMGRRNPAEQDLGGGLVPTEPEEPMAWYWWLLVPFYVVYEAIKKAIKGLPSTRWLLAELEIAENEVVHMVVTTNMQTDPEPAVDTEELIEAVRWELKLPLVNRDIADLTTRYPTDFVADYWNLDAKWRMDRTETGAGVSADTAPSVSVPDWAYAAMESLYEAHVEAAWGNTEEGLRLYFEGKRQLLRGRVSLADANLVVAARTLSKEIEGMADSWRKSRIMELLQSLVDATAQDVQGREAPSRQSPAESGSVERLLEARRLIDEFHLNQYRRVANLRTYLLTFLLVGVVLGSIILGWFAAMLPVPEFFSSFPAWQFYALILAFGGLGATISGIRTVQVESDTPRALGSVLGLWLPLARLVMGSLSAVLVTVFLLSGVIEPSYTTPGVILGVAFASGFSERLLLHTVQSVEGVATRRTTGS